jgi:hypothetical protein
VYYKTERQLIAADCGKAKGGYFIGLLLALNNNSYKKYKHNFSKHIAPGIVYKVN